MAMPIPPRFPWAKTQVATLLELPIMQHYRCVAKGTMRRSFILGIGLVAAAAIGAGVWWWHGYRAPPPIKWQGYADADFVKIGPTQQGLLTTVNVARGDQVAAGAPLFSQDDTADLAARDQAVRQVRQSQEQLANLQAG